MIDLTSDELSIIQSIAKASFSPGTRVWAFGSRVKGTNHDTSDLDLVIHPPATQSTKTATELLEFKQHLQNSNLAILVDVLLWNDLPQHFQINIQQDYEELQF